MPRRVVRRLAPAAISGVLLALPHHFDFLWALSFVAFIPLFYSLESKSRGQAAAAAYLFGIFFFGVMGYWLTYVNVLGFAVLTLYLAVYAAAFGFYGHRFFYAVADVRPSGRILSALYLAALWTLLEWVRGWMLSGLPWALLGGSQWKNLAFIQIADITGIWGVSFAVMLVNVLLYQFLRYKKSAARCAVAALGLVALLYGYGALQLGRWNMQDGRPQLRVSVLQGNIPQDQKWDARVRGIIFEKYKRLTLMCANEFTDLIIWPETSFPGFFEDEPVMAAHLRSAIRHSKTPTLVGAPTFGELPEGGLRQYNTAILFNQNGEEGQRYSKTHLVPFGEYIPFEPVLGFLRHFVRIGDFTPGREKTIFVLKPRAPEKYLTARFGVLICYEDIFPGLCREMARQGADFLVNVTNDAWFGRTAAPYQHAQASVFRAIENRLPVVRAANTGLSCFISASGEVTATVRERGEEIMVTGHATQGIYLRKASSIYSRIGDWFILLCVALLWLCRQDPATAPRYSRL